MQATRFHLALVIVEYSNTFVLVTLEFLVYSVVGEIEDELDEHVAAAVVQRPGGVIEAEARAPLEQLEAVAEQALSLPDFEEEIESVAGLVTALAGRVPQRGEVIPHPAGWDFEVLGAAARRIKRVRR